MRLRCLTTAPPLAATQRPALEPLTRAIAGTIPGLAGYVGVDLIFTPSGPIMVEVDPRLTSA
jgi:predicted ATP-grasp superfamily ATP-dependent carboligase